MIYQFIRDKKRKPIGVVVAISATKLGYTMCNSKSDKWDKQHGIDLATGRAYNQSQFIPLGIPKKVKYTYEKMVIEAKRYYKDESPNPITLSYREFLEKFPVDQNLLLQSETPIGKPIHSMEPLVGDGDLSPHLRSNNKIIQNSHEESPKYDQILIIDGKEFGYGHYIHTNFDMILFPEDKKDHYHVHKDRYRDDFSTIKYQISIESLKAMCKNLTLDPSIAHEEDLTKKPYNSICIIQEDQLDIERNKEDLAIFLDYDLILVRTGIEDVYNVYQDVIGMFSKKGDSEIHLPKEELRNVVNNPNSNITYRMSI